MRRMDPREKLTILLMVLIVGVRSRLECCCGTVKYVFFFLLYDLIMSPLAAKATAVPLPPALPELASSASEEEGGKCDLIVLSRKDNGDRPGGEMVDWELFLKVISSHESRTTEQVTIGDDSKRLLDSRRRPPLLSRSPSRLRFLSIPSPSAVALWWSWS